MEDLSTLKEYFKYIIEFLEKKEKEKPLELIGIRKHLDSLAFFISEKNFNSSIFKTCFNQLSDFKRIVLVGCAASGKDHARKILQNNGFNYGVTYTSRPPRNNEEEGVDYYYISKYLFEDKIKNDEFYEYVSFNGWYYGTSKESFDNKNLFIMTPSGISKILPKDRKESYIIYFDIDENIRRERISLRNDADSVERRIKADALDFMNFENFDLRITEPNFN